MEASRFIRRHEKGAVVDTAERSKRLAPHMKLYAGRLGTGRPMVVEGADGIRREVQFYGDPDGVELKDPRNPEAGWQMSRTDGVPIPTDHGFLDDEPPFGDPL